MKMKVILVKNETHQILPRQEEELKKFGWEGDTINAPASGWNLAEMRAIIENLNKPSIEKTCLVFLSPIPALMVLGSHCKWVLIAAFHNDRREAVEQKMPDGKIIVKHILHPDGWQIVF